MEKDKKQPEMILPEDYYKNIALQMFEPFKPAFVQMAQEIIQEVKHNELHSKEYFNCKDLCSWLNISFGTMQKMERLGMKCIKIDGKKLYNKATVQEFLKSLEQ